MYSSSSYNYWDTDCDSCYFINGFSADMTDTIDCDGDSGHILAITSTGLKDYAHMTEIDSFCHWSSSYYCFGRYFQIDLAYWDSFGILRSTLAKSST